MEHAFKLKHYAHLTMEEQNDMTFEDRKWWLKRVIQELENKNKTEAITPGKREHTPGQVPT